MVSRSPQVARIQICKVEYIATPFTYASAHAKPDTRAIVGKGVRGRRFGAESARRPIITSLVKNIREMVSTVSTISRGLAVTYHAKGAGGL
eukprot:scaffold59905_cov95-Cyclotella_meneghiniana.AAC.2